MSVVPLLGESFGAKFGAMMAEARERREKAYALESPAICKEYGLDAVRDRYQVEQIIAVRKELNYCTVCDGRECLKPSKKYEKPQIDRTGQEYSIRRGDCPVEARRNAIRRAAKYMPARYAGKTFEDYEATPANQKAIGYAHWFLDKGARGLYYYGGCGTGKTFLAVLIAKECLNRGKSIVFGDVPNLLERIKKTFNDPNASSQDILGEFTKCDLLVMDDLGTGLISDWNIGVVYQIINERYNADKAVIITSNYTLDELQDKLAKKDSVSAQRIVSRLREMCYCASLGTEDRRR